MKLVATVGNDKEIAMAENADVIEIRLDLFDDFRRMSLDKEMILTFRKVADGGKFEGSDKERVETLKSLSDELNADYVDLEFDLPDWAFDFDCKIIESYHNFKETPEYSELERIVKNRRGDFAKIVTMGKSRKDVEKIVKLLVNHDNVISFLMGEKFSFTRIMAAYLGSPFIYCYVGERKAPGQIHLDDAQRILRILR
ncbi:type I 3-dehydroquinate dehydratase [Archaeoglobus neptunius]|uniref:type I 3-dehydroquinate dehydratase n=1 Tax=Archaeoglobus neptunius TaxID=2798580 RepID=UPI001926DA54|nr:type I 3-dehydroquinate dehydratase [Archaeoglobus neptunius]